MKNKSRRDFIRKSAMAAGFTALGAETVFGEPSEFIGNQERLPREVWIATVGQHGISADTCESMAQTLLAICKKSLTYRPDIICLPENCLTTFVRKQMTLEEKTDVCYKLLKDFADFARSNNCYLICPIYTRENKKIYNAAVVIDRQGNSIGEFRKIHVTENEMRQEISPGPLHPPVFKTDFGIIGAQICFDILWNDGWEALRQQGAEIVFWPSAYAGGLTVNTKAWQNKYVVVSSTLKDTSKICDITGNVVAQTGLWDRNLICAPVNLEKVFLHTWPFVQRFDEIKAKYGRKVRITNYHEEEWSILESLSPDVRVKDILAEFNIKTFEQLKDYSENMQNKARG